MLILSLYIVISTQYGSRKDAEAALELFAKGTVRAIVATEPLSHVNKIIDELRSFNVRGRKVVTAHHGKVKDILHFLHET
jgi:D-arabinose 1-dehydrogenase-like Zn-dependent alcohol dehydrogenase